MIENALHEGRAMRVLAASALLAWASALPAQTPPREKAGKSVEAARNLARVYYPAIASASRIPQGVFIGFLVDRQMKVLRHSSGFTSQPEVLLSSELMRLFPDQAISPDAANGACFGGGDSKEPRYCVFWAEVEK
jgi:hypothetical protein